ncbi:hypothetical protein BDN72DRAFT_900756 [Pluteus cervinus]|uniref:Uncharacterized protein n=1 Tax=Pluteus cervinus TaxID=181527 RepID=A0ACD3AI45_9AGAR|nr:hypothetical protein BDN72DRAFT_900756 [Pluteus cervinus]
MSSNTSPTTTAIECSEAHQDAEALGSAGPDRTNQTKHFATIKTTFDLVRLSLFPVLHISTLPLNRPSESSTDHIVKPPFIMESQSALKGKARVGDAAVDHETQPSSRTTRKMMEVLVPPLATRSRTKRSLEDQEAVEGASTSVASTASRPKRKRVVGVQPSSAELSSSTSEATQAGSSRVDSAPPLQVEVKGEDDDEELFGPDSFNEDKRQIAGLYGHIKGLRFICAGGPPPQDVDVDDVEVSFEDYPELQAEFLKEQVKALEFGFRLNKRLG